MTRPQRYARLRIIDISIAYVQAVVESAPTPTGPWKRAGRTTARKYMRWLGSDTEVNGIVMPVRIM